jgi:hypothetical protein
MLVQEEKALHVSRTYLRDAELLEPHFVAVYRLHAADEAHHVNWDEELIAELWPRVPHWWRQCNARLLDWLLLEFFPRAETRRRPPPGPVGPGVFPPRPRPSRPCGRLSPDSPATPAGAAPPTLARC